MNNPSTVLPFWVITELRSATGKGVRVGVIDSGWDRTRSNPQVHKGIGLVDSGGGLSPGRNNDDHDRVGHGTTSTGLILNIAPECDIYPIRVFGTQMETTVSAIGDAIRWAINSNLSVLNLSLGTLRDDAIIPMYAACEEARKHGLIIVAARHNTRPWSYPSVFENVIGVDTGTFASPFDYLYRTGEATECMARGSKQLVLCLNGQQVYKSGTSLAAPNISGIIALFLERYPDGTLEDVRAFLARHSLKG